MKRIRYSHIVIGNIGAHMRAFTVLLNSYFFRFSYYLYSFYDSELLLRFMFMVI